MFRQKKSSNVFKTVVLLLSALFMFGLCYRLFGKEILSLLSLLGCGFCLFVFLYLISVKSWGDVF